MFRKKHPQYIIMCCDNDNVPSPFMALLNFLQSASGSKGEAGVMVPWVACSHDQQYRKLINSLGYIFSLLQWVYTIDMPREGPQTVLAIGCQTLWHTGWEYNTVCMLAIVILFYILILHPMWSRRDPPRESWSWKFVWATSRACKHIIIRS